MGTLDGKVAFITGAARGQGRSHALRLASEGADIVALDICRDIPTMDYPNASEADLAETARLVRGLGRRIITREVDVRDPNAVRQAASDGFDLFGRLDIVLANAGIIRLTDVTSPEQGDALWQDVIGTNLSGVWHAAQATMPYLIKGGQGGVMIFTGSTAGTRPHATLKAGALAYISAKTALVGLAKALAASLAQHSIRVNVVHPTGVVSGMTQNDAMKQLAAQAAAGGSNSISSMQNAMPIAILQAEDITNAVAFLVSDQARWITGVSLPVDAGFSVR